METPVIQPGFKQQQQRTFSVTSSSALDKTDFIISVHKRKPQNKNDRNVNNLKHHATVTIPTSPPTTARLALKFLKYIMLTNSKQKLENLLSKQRMFKGNSASLTGIYLHLGKAHQK